MLEDLTTPPVAYRIPPLLVAVLVDFDGNNSIIFNSMIQKPELNQGLKALELVMNVSVMACNQMMNDANSEGK